MKKKEIRIRAATPGDAEALLAIYAPYVLNTAISFEYEPPSAGEFRARMARTLARYPWLAAEEDGRLLGYAYAGAFNARKAYELSAEASIYVAGEMKKRGFGRLLYGALEDALREQHVLNVNACIACTDCEDEYLTNNSAGFHAHLGYSTVGVFHQCAFKFGRWYDMVWMEKQLGPHGASPAPLLPFDRVRGTLREKYGIE